MYNEIHSPVPDEVKIGLSLKKPFTPADLIETIKGLRIPQ
jgi:hypothetical protein